jgi:aldehyde dehydrogenase (NAD+)
MTVVEPTAVSLQHADRFYINGDWVQPSSTDMFDVIEPSTENVFLRVAAAKAEDVSNAVAAARQAFDKGPWPRMSHVERAVYLHAIAEQCDSRLDVLGRIHTSEMGILNGVARAVASSVGNIFEYYAGLASTFPFVERHQPTVGGNVGLLVREPVGVVAAIVPWNSAMAMIAYKIAPALLAGCTVVIKASPDAPGEAYVMAEIAAAIGIPAGVINVITADRAESELLVKDHRVDKITFTGSTVAGRRIASICGERIARYTLELGGKSAAVILDDYDLAAAATSLTGAAAFMTGQVCSSLTRVIVSRQRHDALVDALSSAFSNIKVGDPFDPDTQMGPLAMSRQRDRVEQYIATGLQEGARLAAGGGRPDHLERGFFIEPTVFGNVDNRSTIAQEEIFGPVLSVIAADNEAHAVELANDTIYGLNASVFTDDEDRAYRVARELRSGTVGHNAWRSDFGISFGGFKQSGTGREGGVEGLHPYMEAKTIILDKEPSEVI